MPALPHFWLLDTDLRSQDFPPVVGSRYVIPGPPHQRPGTLWQKSCFAYPPHEKVPRVTVPSSQLWVPETSDGYTRITKAADSVGRTEQELHETWWLMTGPQLPKRPCIMVTESFLVTVTMLSLYQSSVNCWSRKVAGNFVEQVNYCYYCHLFGLELIRLPERVQDLPSQGTGDGWIS